MDTHTKKAIAGAAMAPLSNEQKKELVLLAKRAYEFRRQSSEVRGQTLEEWRHTEQKLAVERGSLTVCTNEDFLFLKAHFLSLLGKKELASQVRVKAATEPHAWAMARFERECKAAADVLPQARDYAAGFLRNARGVTLDQASEKQIWHAVFIIRRRASQLRRKIEARSGLAVPGAASLGVARHGKARHGTGGESLTPPVSTKGEKCKR